MLKEGKRATPTWLFSVDITGVHRWQKNITFGAFSQHCDFHQLNTKSSSSADEDHSAGWKLQFFIYFHRNLSAPVMSTDNSQGRCRSLSFLLTYFYHYTFIRTHIIYIVSSHVKEKSDKREILTWILYFTA